MFPSQFLEAVTTKADIKTTNEVQHESRFNFHFKVKISPLYLKQVRHSNLPMFLLTEKTTARGGVWLKFIYFIYILPLSQRYNAEQENREEGTLNYLQTASHACFKITVGDPFTNLHPSHLNKPP